MNTKENTDYPKLPLIVEFTVKAHSAVDYQGIAKLTNPSNTDRRVMIWDATPTDPAEYLDGTFSEVRYAEGPMSREQFEGFFRGCIEQKPAPAEKEEGWWKDDAYWVATASGSLAPSIPKIVTEAKRRGAEEAWKEAKAMVQAGGEACEDVPRKIGWWDVRNRINAKLESLNKPAGAGEK